ncbi:Na+/H+ antiporter NhaC family protein [bacterium]|nr:Na+/H+ antiporter NhaC family protein [bacterium]
MHQFVRFRPLLRLSALLAAAFLAWAAPARAGSPEGSAQRLELPVVSFADTPIAFSLDGSAGDSAGAAGWTVELKDGQSVLASAVTDSSGKATLTAPGSGRFTVSASRAGVHLESGLRVLPGFLTLLPPLVAIIFALMFRQVLPALFLGIWVGTSLLAGINPWTGLVRLIDTYFVQAMTDRDHVRIIVFSMTLGGMVGLIARSGGATGLVERFSRLAVSRRMGQVSTWLLGLLIFFDDYSNTLMVGNTMRPFTDKLRISREKLSYIVDSTSAPVACVALISTWIGFELGLLGTSISELGLDINAYWLFLRAVPFNFYSIVTIIFVLLVALTGRDFGPMRQAESRAFSTGEVLGPRAQPLVDDEMTRLQDSSDAPPRWYNAIVPIGVMSAVLLAGLYASGLHNAAAGGKAPTLYNVIGAADPFQVLLWAAFAGTFTAMAMSMAQRIMNLRECVDSFIIGFKSLTIAMIILTLARVIQIICTDLNTANYLLNISRGFLKPGFLPALTFVLGAAISFSTGTSWGTMAILMPLVVPLAHYLPLDAGLSPEVVDLTMVATVGAVLSGAVFGDHCSPISDTTIMSSMASGADHVDHVRTQLPYALVVGGVTTVIGYLPAAMGFIHPFVSILLSVAVLWALLRYVGRPVQDSVPD